MFFEVPDWKVGKPKTEDEVLKARKEEELKLKGPKPSKKVTFSESSSKKKDADKSEEVKPSVKSLKVTKPTVKKDESEKLKAKLSGSRFRYLNQILYESDSKSALSYFQEHQDDFLRYHEGFQEQTKKWPTNPVDIFIKDLSTLIGRLKDKEEFVVADLGCGEGKLGLEIGALARKKSKRGVVVHSYDLVAVGDHVKVASMTQVPLLDASVNLVVFSLSLMNTDFTKALLEANRILKPSGLLWIAEVESRFDGGFAGIDGFGRKLWEFGFQLQGSMDLSHRVFVLMRFHKSKHVSKVTSDVTLKACKYKKR